MLWSISPSALFPMPCSSHGGANAYWAPPPSTKHYRGTAPHGKCLMVTRQLIMVRKHGHARKYIARVLACGAECDLALLTVNEEEFWDDIEHLELGDVPHLQEVVTVVGYPTGGDSVSVTKGVVSRLNLQQYSHASFHLLAIQIDAAINAGNSGGPALQGEKVAGVAFETLLDAENIGYIIPVPVIEHFLRDVDNNKKYRGFCDIGLFWQEMENTDFKAHMKMKPGQSGVYVTRVQPLAKVNKVIRPGDVILAFDGKPLADDGTVSFREKELIEFTHLVSMKFVDESATLTLLRDGCQIDVVTPLDMNKQLVPIHLYNLDGPPPYFIYAGLVFLVCSQPLLRAQYGKDWECKGPIQLCEKAAHGVMESEGQELVLLSQVLAHEVNTGYQNLSNVEVLAVNGVKVHDLRHLAKMLLTNTGDYVKIDVEKHKTIVLSVQRAIAAQDEILVQHCIPAPCPAGFLEAAGLPDGKGSKTAGITASIPSKTAKRAATKKK
eukprot:jgi/Mesvir1/19037/Mv12800-RA.2